MMSEKVRTVPDVRISQITAPPFYTVHQDIRRADHSDYWLKGGRGSTKSSFISCEIVEGLLRDPLANGIVYRKVAANLKTSVYEQIAWAINLMGLSPWFRFLVSPMEIIYKPTGQRILFRGADDAGKSKSIKLAKGYFKYLWFEELTEFDGMDDIRTIKDSVVRVVDHFFTFYSYNPPKSANNWVNVEALIPVPGRLVHHSNYTQVPQDWLGIAFIANAEALREVNPAAYQHVYMGEVTGTGGQVFDNVVLRTITREERQKFDRFLNGGDFGFASDPDAVIRAHHDRHSQRLYLMDEIYGIRMNVDVLAEKLRTLIGIEYVTYDNEDPRMINELHRRGVRVLPARKGPGSIEHGMRWLQERAQIIIDPVTCPNAAREFAAYEYKQDRFGNFLSEYPDKDNHLIDATRYSCESEMHGRLGFAPTTIPGTVQTDRIFRR